MCVRVPNGLFTASVSDRVTGGLQPWVQGGIPCVALMSVSIVESVSGREYGGWTHAQSPQTKPACRTACDTVARGSRGQSTSTTKGKMLGNASTPLMCNTCWSGLCVSFPHQMWWWAAASKLHGLGMTEGESATALIAAVGAGMLGPCEVFVATGRRLTSGSAWDEQHRASGRDVSAWLIGLGTISIESRFLEFPLASRISGSPRHPCLLSLPIPLPPPWWPYTGHVIGGGVGSNLALCTIV